MRDGLFADRVAIPEKEPLGPNLLEAGMPWPFSRGEKPILGLDWGMPFGERDAVDVFSRVAKLAHVPFLPLEDPVI